jgi:hypothetical protein
MYFDPLKEYNWFQQIDKENAFIISFTTLFALGFVFYPAPFYLLAHKAVFTLYL